MPDYKALFYQSQAALADAIEALTALTAQLEQSMQDAEEAAIAEEPSGSHDRPPFSDSTRQEIF